MPRPRNVTPSYIPHAKSGRGRLQWYDAAGTRHEKLLPGPYGSAESLAAKATLELELVVSPTRSPVPDTAAGVLTVAELLVAYLDFAEQHYRYPDGKPTSEIGVVKVVIRAVRELYAETPVTEFGPLALKAARQKWVNENRARTECNRRVRIVRRIFAWGVSEQLVPATVLQALTTVSGPKAGRTTARETEPIGPVNDAVVDATLPYLNRHVRGLVEFQRLTGCRPGEACAVRRCDIETGEAVWTFRLTHHKTAHHGKTRTVCIGPRAQQLLMGFFTPVATDYLFSPARAVEELRAQRSANRKPPLFRSHIEHNAKRRKANPKRAPRARYNRTSYTYAVRRACEAAFPPPTPLARLKGESVKGWKARLTEEQKKELTAWRNGHGWAPNQLRHSHGTRVRKTFGLEAAGAALGHTKMSETEVYAVRDAALAATVAAKIG